jgi:acetate kinase
MISLILNPSPRRLEYSLFPHGGRKPVAAGTVSWNFAQPDEVRKGLDQAIAQCSAKDAAGPQAVCIRIAHGGAFFRKAAVVNDQVLKDLNALTPAAPLHIPLALSIIKVLRRTLPAVPIVLAFDTAFFASLPAREHLYGLDPHALGHGPHRRYGYHGLYHQAACAGAAYAKVGRTTVPPAGGTGILPVSSMGVPPMSPTGVSPVSPRPAKVISICMEPRPEIAAVCGASPVMVTSGATPLEGLPGETSCGELDPSIVLALARKLKWGPEQINAVLTNQSGVAALAGRRITLQTLFTPRSPYRLARDVMRYRILLACGSAIAAMGGLDAIVFSGRYANIAQTSLGNWLVKKLTWHVGAPAVTVHVLHDRLDQILAEVTVAAIGQTQVQTAAG